MSKTWSHTYWLYIFPEDFKKIKTFLKQEHLYCYLYGYDVGLVGFKMTWYITDEKKPTQVCSYNNQPEVSGVFKGMYCLRVSWAGPEDASHIINFKRKYNLGLYQVGFTSDWLGEPICLLFTPETKAKCQDILKELKENYVTRNKENN